MSKLVLSCAVALSLILLSTAAWSQAVGGPVTADVAGGPLTTDAPGSPDDGDYSALVTAYIESYARVTVYDNFINFGALTATKGSYAGPEETIAIGVAAPVVAVPGVTTQDIAGGRIDTNCRLNMMTDLGGHLTRCTETGTAFGGADTRKVGGVGNYELATQYKLNLHGRYYGWGDGDFAPGDKTNPAENAVGTQLKSPTNATTACDYNLWTGWKEGASLGDPGAVGDATGWVWPAKTGATTPWNGAAYTPGTGTKVSADGIKIGDETEFARVDAPICAVVERGQAQLTGRGLGASHYGDAAAAEWWVAARVLQRGLQDVSGNYRSNIGVNIYYRETPADWTPS